MVENPRFGELQHFCLNDGSPKVSYYHQEILAQEN